MNTQETKLFTLSNKNGMEAVITNYGARIQAIRLADKNGKICDMELGFDTVEEYYPENNKTDFGALIGQYANRISGAKFTLDGVEYALPVNDNGCNCLHGGPLSWEYRVWNVEEVDCGHIVLSLVSPDGDNGFPGVQNVKVTYTLTEDNRLDIRYEATTDKATVVNLTNHSYFNLSDDHANYCIENDILYLNASHFAAIDKVMIPTGELAPVDGTPFDFRTPHAIGDHINEVENEQIAFGTGYDHCYILDTKGDDSIVAASVLCPATGIKLEIYTTEPGVQLYTSNWLDGSIVGKGGVAYKVRSAFCLETGHYPDSPNKPQFPTTTLRPGELYSSHTVFAFSVEK